MIRHIRSLVPARRLRSFTVLLLLAAPAVPAPGGSSGEHPSPDLSDQRLSVELVDADLRETLKGLGKALEATVSVAPRVEGHVTYSVQGATAASVFHDLCRQHELECLRLEGDPAVIQVRPATGWSGLVENIDMVLAEASLGQVLTSFETVSAGAVQVRGDFVGTVTVDLQARPWTQVLEHLCSVGDCRIDWQSEPARVVPAAP